MQKFAYSPPIKLLTFNSALALFRAELDMGSSPASPRSTAWGLWREGQGKPISNYIPYFWDHQHQWYLEKLRTSLTVLICITLIWSKLFFFVLIDSPAMEKIVFFSCWTVSHTSKKLHILDKRFPVPPLLQKKSCTCHKFPCTCQRVSCTCGQCDKVADSFL